MIEHETLARLAAARQTAMLSLPVRPGSDARYTLGVLVVVNEEPWEHDSEPIALDEAYWAALRAAGWASTHLHTALRRAAKLDRLVKDLARQCDAFEAQLRKAGIAPELVR